MTGLLVWSAQAGEPHPHDRLVFELEGGPLRYRDMRRFGDVWLAGSKTDRAQIMGPLGPDALEVSEDELAELLGRRRGQIKSALSDQRLIAGPGNLLSDELLWRARIHPRHPAARLSPRRVTKLHRCLVEMLRQSNRHARVRPSRAGSPARVISGMLAAHDAAPP